MKYSLNGSCRYGNKCRFQHNPRVPGGDHEKVPRDHHAKNAEKKFSGSEVHVISPKNGGPCSFCSGPGHSVDVCRKKAAAVARKNAGGARPSAMVCDASAETDRADCQLDDDSSPFTLMMMQVLPGPQPFRPPSGPACGFLETPIAPPAHAKHIGWVLDSGATHSCTYDQSDCKDVRECSITVTAAGNVFEISLMGTACIDAVNDRGSPQRVIVKNCLISSRFPYKLLAMQSFTNKGHTVFVRGNFKITNPDESITLQVVFLGRFGHP